MEVTSRDYLLDDKRIDPTFKRKILATIKALRAKGYPVVVVEAYRTKARAALMKIQKKSLIGSASKHCLGKAADIAFLVNGKITWDVPISYWNALGKSGKSYGLQWGGDWHRLKDYNHLEL